MIKFAVRFLVSIVLVGGAWALVLTLVPGPYISRWVAGIYERKESEARQVQGPKYVIVGGSGVHFSYSAEVVSRASGLPIVNLGTHAGLGADYILHRARRSLRPSDTVILALEYGLIDTGRPSTVLASFVMTQDLAYLASAPLSDLPVLVFGHPPLEVIREAVAGFVPWTSPLLRWETVTDYGDESANVPEIKQPYMLEGLRTGLLIGLYPPDPLSPSRVIREFTDWAEANDVHLAMAWPVSLEKEAYLSAEYANYFALYAETFENLGFTILTPDYTRYLLPEDVMFDTPHHADTVGAARVSANLAEDLCRHVACPGPGRDPEPPRAAGAP